METSRTVALWLAVVFSLCIALCFPSGIYFFHKRRHTQPISGRYPDLVLILAVILFVGATFLVFLLFLMSTGNQYISSEHPNIACSIYQYIYMAGIPTVTFLLLARGLVMVFRLEITRDLVMLGTTAASSSYAASIASDDEMGEASGASGSREGNANVRQPRVIEVRVQAKLTPSGSADQLQSQPTGGERPLSDRTSAATQLKQPLRLQPSTRTTETTRSSRHLSWFTRNHWLIQPWVFLRVLKILGVLFFIVIVSTIPLTLRSDACARSGALFTTLSAVVYALVSPQFLLFLLIGWRLRQHPSDS